MLSGLACWHVCMFLPWPFVQLGPSISARIAPDASEKTGCALLDCFLCCWRYPALRKNKFMLMRWQWWTYSPTGPDLRRPKVTFWKYTVRCLSFSGFCSSCLQYTYPTRNEFGLVVASAVFPDQKRCSKRSGTLFFLYLYPRDQFSCGAKLPNLLFS